MYVAGFSNFPNNFFLLEPQAFTVSREGRRRTIIRGIEWSRSI